MAKRKTAAQPVPQPLPPPQSETTEAPALTRTPRPSVGDLLRQAIAERDWSKVGEAYFTLTGEDVGALPPSEDSLLLRRVRDLLRESPEQALMCDEIGELVPVPVAPATPPPQPSPQKEYRPPFRYVRLTCAGCKQTSDVHPQCVPVALGSDDHASDFICDSCQVRGIKGGEPA